MEFGKMFEIKMWQLKKLGPQLKKEIKKSLKKDSRKNGFSKKRH